MEAPKRTCREFEPDPANEEAEAKQNPNRRVGLVDLPTRQRLRRQRPQTAATMTLDQAISSRSDHPKNMRTDSPRQQQPQPKQVPRPKLNGRGKQRRGGQGDTIRYQTALQIPACALAAPTPIGERGALHDHGGSALLTSDQLFRRGQIIPRPNEGGVRQRARPPHPHVLVRYAIAIPTIGGDFLEVVNNFLTKYCTPTQYTNDDEELLNQTSDQNTAEMVAARMNKTALTKLRT